MSWGYKILTVYILFVAGILFLVFKSATQNQDLVTADYYEQELKFQQRIDETERANALSTDVACEISGDTLILRFPPEMKGKKLTGNMLLYCIADKNKDVKMNISTGDAESRFKVPSKNKGMHEVKINWMAEETSYYFSKKIMIK